MMKVYQLKQPIIFASLFLALVCFFSACSKKSPFPTSTRYNDSTGTGSDTSGNDSTASFNAPTGLAVDAAGNIYVADYGNNKIRKISIAGVVSTLAGSGNQGSVNGPGNLATFNGPTGVAVDGVGNVYVADQNNNQIRAISATGVVSTLAGSDSTGVQDGLGALAYFFAPSGVATDAQGNVYVADAGNNNIRMITPGGQTTTIAGNNNPGTQNGAALSATFNNPTGITIDAAGNIYIADMLSNQIRKLSGGVVSTLAGGDTTASINGVGTAASFFFPNSVAVDGGGNVYVTEYATDLVRKITPDGTVTTFAGSGQPGQADSTGTAASFNGPSGVAVDGAGNVYIADTFNNVIRKITPGGAVTTIAGNGTAGSSNGKALSLRKAKGLNSVRKVNKANNGVLFKILVKKKVSQNILLKGLN
jgi:sugar lactone lactonase YvrE